MKLFDDAAIKEAIIAIKKISISLDHMDKNTASNNTPKDFKSQFVKLTLSKSGDPIFIKYDDIQSIKSSEHTINGELKSVSYILLRGDTDCIEVSESPNIIFDLVRNVIMFGGA